MSPSWGQKEVCERKAKKWRDFECGGVVKTFREPPGGPIFRPEVKNDLVERENVKGFTGQRSERGY